MPRYLTQKEAYARCKKEGKFFILEELNKEQICSMITAAESDLQTAISTAKTIHKDDIRWNSVYKLSYESIHELTEAYLRLKRIKIENHQCLFAYLCERYPELELDWEFFEQIRTKRNGITYYGQLILYEDWKKSEMRFKIYAKRLKDEILVTIEA